MSYTLEFNTKWADFDANRHMRHTAYNDYAAEVRIRYFAFAGFSVDRIAADGFGPILFTEHTSFKREILMGEKITANAKLLGLSDDKGKWKIQHEVFNEAGQLSATIDVYGAWISLEKRKLTLLPRVYDSLFNHMEKTTDFKVIQRGRK